jgi:hypothetical protein
MRALNFLTRIAVSTSLLEYNLSFPSTVSMVAGVAVDTSVDTGVAVERAVDAGVAVDAAVDTGVAVGAAVDTGEVAVDI